MTQTVGDAIRILRKYKGEQITGDLLNAKGGRCAMGVLGGADLTVDDDDEVYWRGQSDHVVYTIGREFGLMEPDVEDIIHWNDGPRRSFMEIADMMEAASSPTGAWCEEARREPEAE